MRLDHVALYRSMPLAVHEGSDPYFMTAGVLTHGFYG